MQIALSPIFNPTDGFGSALEDPFVIIIMNLMCFEQITKGTMGALEKALGLFTIHSGSYFGHPFLQ